MLLDRNGTTLDIWTRSEGAAVGNIAHALVPWEALPEAVAAKTPGQRLGVVAPNNIGIADLEPLLSELALIAVAFPGFSDGRGFSIARQLRRQGFTGTLRASGPLIADQFAYALSCGFDEVELPETISERQPAEQWQRALHQISVGYQRGYGDGGSILDRRRAGRLELVG